MTIKCVVRVVDRLLYTYICIYILSSFNYLCIYIYIDIYMYVGMHVCMYIYKSSERFSVSYRISVHLSLSCVDVKRVFDIAERHLANKNLWPFF